MIPAIKNNLKPITFKEASKEAAQFIREKSKAYRSIRIYL